MLLLEEPTDDSVEIAVELVRKVVICNRVYHHQVLHIGEYLTMVAPQGLNAILDRLRDILHGSTQLDKKVMYTIERLFAVAKPKGKEKKVFEEHPSIMPVCVAHDDDDGTGTRPCRRW